MRKRTIEEINEIYHKSYPYIDVIEFLMDMERNQNYYVINVDWNGKEIMVYIIVLIVQSLQRKYCIKIDMVINIKRN